MNKETGRAGIGFNTQGKDTAELQNEVFNFPWSNFYPATEAELQESKCGENLAALTNPTLKTKHTLKKGSACAVSLALKRLKHNNT